MITLTSGNYVASIEYSERDRCWVGHIRLPSHIVGFHLEEWDMIEGTKLFERAIDDYIMTCETLGKTPETSLGGW